ncbi:helix-turn-helix domain-containing protein [Promicromonospora soli]
MSRSNAAARLRAGLLSKGCDIPEIAAAIRQQLNERPRAAWRRAMGWSQATLVERYKALNSGYRLTVSRVSEYEAWPYGGTEPPLHYLTRLARTFGCDVTDLVDDADLERLSPADRAFVSARRPAMTLSLSDATLEMAERVRLGFANPRRFADAGLVSVFRLQLETAKAVDGRSGAAAALPTSLGVVAGLRSVLPDIPDHAQSTALTLSAEAAEFTGWLFRDLANNDQASYWYDQAMEYAQRCGDTAMQGYVLMRKSQMSYDAGDGQRVLEYARAALDGPWKLTTLGHAETVLQFAKGELMTGQRADIEDTIQRAQDLAPDHHALLHVREATCWIEAGEPERAVALYDQALASSGLSTRDRGFFRARRAVALAQAGLPMASAATALDALDVAVQTGSNRTLQVVGDARTKLLPWRTDPLVDQLGQALSSQQ